MAGMRREVPRRSSFKMRCLRVREEGLLGRLM